MMKGQLTDPKSILSFILAGNATITFRSAKTGNRYTYKIRQAEPNQGETKKPDMYFVKLLTGADNESSYTYIGIVVNGKFKTTRASKMGSDSIPVKTFIWVMENIQKGTLPELLEVWHEGRCGKCGRKLTVPESIATGFGPDCAATMVDLPTVQSAKTPVIDQPKSVTVQEATREEIGDDYIRLCREKTTRTAVSATQLSLEPMVTIQGVTMPMSQAEATASAIENFLDDSKEQGLDNVPEL